MIKIGDTFKADGDEWKVTDIDDMEGVSVSYDKYSLNICSCDKVVYAYEKLKNGRTKCISWRFTFDEIKMIAEIIDKLKGEVK